MLVDSKNQLTLFKDLRRDNRFQAKLTLQHIFNKFEFDKHDLLSAVPIRAVSFRLIWCKICYLLNN